ncbi:MAG TPA: hypothetical protein VHY79_14140 [Rhizomicrobium sp.]|nr:hypothetical protein [Rhizomicrobium sp.]
MSFRAVILAASAALSIAVASAVGAAALHAPLPPDSTEVNGTPQMGKTHPVSGIAPPALPDVGLHRHAAQGLKRRYTGTPIDMLNYHNDNYPTGWNQSETDLTPASVSSGSFGQLTTLNVDGNVLAQPLIVSNFVMPDGSTHNVLIVATGHNTIYAYDAQDYSVLWQASLGQSQSSNDVGCQDIKPEYGISSTPVIVRQSASSATIYVVAATEPKPFSFHTKLHAIDVGTGKDVTKPHEIAPVAKLENGGKIHFDPQNQWNRSGLLSANGSIYLGVGSHCDNNAGSISGWVLNFDATTLAEAGKFNTIEASAGYELASVWMSGYAVASDPTGNIFAVTGNGNYSQQKGARGYGESVLSLSSNLKKLNTSFTPSDYQTLNNGDTDFGSGGVMLIPVQPGQTAPEMALAAGKAGTLYLLNATDLGGEHANDTGALQKLSLGGCWCGPAFYVGPQGPVVFFQGNGDDIRSFSVGTGANPQLTQIAEGTSAAGGGGSFPVVSSNGAIAETGVVWLIRRGSTEQLEAYDAESLGTPLFASNAGTWSNGSRSYLSPMVANGRIYVGAYKTVTVFGLTD